MEQASGVLQRIKGVPVLVVGDVMLDRYVYGEVERVSAEAPVPVLKIAREVSMLGGAGNVVRNLSALKARPALVAAVGADEQGRAIRALLSEAGATADLVQVSDRPTSLKTRFFAARGHPLLRTDCEDARPLTDADAGLVAAAARGAIGNMRGLLVSDYAKGVLTPSVLAAAIGAAHAAGLPVVVDPRGDDYSRYRGADVVTPNRGELKQAARHAVERDDEIVGAAERLIEQHALGAVLATRGADGMTLVRAGQRPLHLPARTQANAVFDVSGAGDTVAAVLAASLAAGIELEAAVHLANVAAGIVVAKVGTAVARLEEIEQALLADPDEQFESKLKPLDAALEQVARWRRQGLTVGFTNGCFDLLHPGHVGLFAQARAACDRLIVGLNADVSVRRLKGPGRPVQDERSRATVIAALNAVDAVVLFDTDTPIDLIRAIRPDILVKGADYRVEEVVGGDFVLSYGGRVLLADLTDGHSTTATLARIGAERVLG